MDDRDQHAMDDLAGIRVSVATSLRYCHIARIYLRLRAVVLTVMACIGAVSLMLFIGATAFGLRPMVVISASMEPTIGVGSLMLSVETTSSALRVGDVVTVRAGDTKHLVTHRIVESGGCEQDQCTFTTKGDANTANDPREVVLRSAPRMWVVIPRLGFAILWMRTLRGLLCLASAVLLLAVLTLYVPIAGKEGRHDWRES